MVDESKIPKFVAIDFEHATKVKGSVCSVGIATFDQHGEVIDEYYTLIKPPNNEFDWQTTRIHRINAEDTKNVPEFVDVYPEIRKRVMRQTVVAHGAFGTDKHCLEQAMEINRIYEDLEIEWDCTYRICKCSLDIASKALNIDLDHHHAMSDAIVCGKIYEKHLVGELPIHELQALNLKLKDNKENRAKDFFPQNLKGDILKPDFDNVENTENPFFRKKVVISGFTFEEKTTIADQLKKLGADIDICVSKKTNFLIVGPTAGPSKIERMRQNIDEGRTASIVTMAEFHRLLVTS